MNDASAGAETDRAELRNWLAAAYRHRRTWAGVVQRVRSEWPRWLSPLIFLATHEPAPVLTMAVKILKTVAAESQDAGFLGELLVALPRKSSALAPVAAFVTERMLEHFPDPSRRADLEAARLWNNLSERCQDANRPDDALRYARQAVAVSQAVASDSASTQRVRAVAWLTLAKRWAERGATGPALEAAASGFDLASTLAKAGAPADRLLEAQAAVVLANRFAATGDIKRAMAAGQTARFYFDQSDAGEDRRYDLALLDHFLAGILTRQGRHEAALPFSENAERLFRILVAESPDEYQEYSAAAAYAYAINLTQVGDVQRAYDLSRLAVERMTPLVSDHPLRFGADYTAYLLGLSDSAAELGKFHEALEVASDAVRAVQRLGRRQRRRDWYLEGQCHTNRFNLLYRLQRFPEAEQATRAAVRAFGRMDDSHPEAAIEQARSLRNLAEAQRMMSGSAKVAKAVQTARLALARLPDGRVPITEARQLVEAQCRTTMANCLEEAGDFAAALQEDQASLVIQRDLFARSARVHRPDLAYCLLQTAKRTLLAGRMAEAAALAAEGVGHYETIGMAGEERTVAFFAEALRVLAVAQSAQGDRSAALQNLVHGIGLLRPRYAMAPDLWLASLLPLCTHYVELCGQAGLEFEAALVQDVIAHAMRSQVGTQAQGPP